MQTVLRKAYLLIQESGLNHQQIGERMEYPSNSARQSVGQFLNSTNPSIEMLRRFAEALGVEAGSLL